MQVFTALSEGSENTIVLGVFSTFERAIDAVMVDARDTLGSIGNADVLHSLFEDLRTVSRTRCVDGADVAWSIHADELDRPLV